MNFPPPPSKLKQQNRKCQRSIIGVKSEPNCCSSSCSPLTISDNEGIDDMDVNSGDEVCPNIKASWCGR